MGTTYRYIYSKDGMCDDLWWYLPTHRVAHRPRRRSSVANPNSTAMSASCSALTMWRTVASSVIGRAI